MAKQIISESRLREIISEEAARFKKKLTLEAEKKKLLKRLNEMYTEEAMEEAQMEEGWLEEGDNILEENLLKQAGEWIMKKVGLKDSPEDVEKRKKYFLETIAKLKGMGYEKFQYDKEKVSEEDLGKKAEENGFSGKIISIPSAAIVAYQPGAYGLSRLSSAGASKGLGV